MSQPEQPRPERKLDTARPDLFAWVEQRLQSERKLILEAVGEAIGEMLAEQHRNAKTALQDEVRQLKIEFCELQTRLSCARSWPGSADWSLSPSWREPSLIKQIGGLSGQTGARCPTMGRASRLC